MRRRPAGGVADGAIPAENCVVRDQSSIDDANRDVERAVPQRPLFEFSEALAIGVERREVVPGEFAYGALETGRATRDEYLLFIAVAGIQQ